MDSNSKLQSLSHDKDRISTLPDSILCHILSFLPTKYAVVSGVLSTRWKSIWANVPNLDFNDSLFFRPQIDHINPRQKLNFMNFVDRVLMLRDNAMNIEKFNLYCRGNCVSDRVNEWICVAIRHNVRELDLGLNLRQPFTLPKSVFNCETLVVLKLTWKICIDVPTPVCFSSLKILHLSCVKFTDYDSRNRLLCGCPVLEDLVIKRCIWVAGCILNVCGSALKNLTIYYHKAKLGDPEYKIVVNAPSLEYFSFKDYASGNYLIENLCSLIRANVDVACNPKRSTTIGDYGNRVFELLRGISTIKFLSLSGETMQALNNAYEYNLPAFHNLTHLELGVDGWCGWKLLPNLLASSPVLEVLVFEEGLIQLLHFQLGVFQSNWSPPENVPTCLLLHLEAIEIRDFRGVKEELKVVKYLLKNAKVFEEDVNCFFFLEGRCEDPK